MPNLSPRSPRGNRPSIQASGRRSRPVAPLPGPSPADPALDSFTELDGRRWRGITYVDCYFYFDTLKFLSKHPISEVDQEFLRGHCKHLDIRAHGKMVFPKNGKPYQLNIEPERFRVEIHLPDDAALAYFAKCPGLKLTRTDPARSFTFDDATGSNAMLQKYLEHFIQPYQRKQRAHVHFENGGISTGRRPKGHYFTGYSDKPCRIDGVIDCFHFEGRHLKAKALAQIGLHHPRDLLDFDHAGYWQQIENQFLAIDKEHLGRFHENRRNRLRRRNSAQEAFHGRRSRDYWLGALLYRIHAIDQSGSLSVRQFLASYGKGPFIIHLDQ